MKAEEFIKIFKDFQGKINDESFDFIYNTLPEENKDYMYLLTSRKKDYELLKSRNIEINKKLPLHQHWHNVITIDLDFYKLLKEIKHPHLENLTVKIFTNNMRNMDVIEEICKDFDFNNERTIKRFLNDNAVLANNIKYFLDNTTFDLEKFHKLYKGNNKIPLHIPERNLDLLFKKYNSDELLNFVQKTILSHEIIEYGLKNNLLDTKILNEFLPEKKCPIYAMNSWSINYIINEDKTDFRKEIDLSICSMDKLGEIFKDNDKYMHIFINKVNNVNDIYIEGEPLLTHIINLRSEEAFEKNFALYREKGGQVNLGNDLYNVRMFAKMSNVRLFNLIANKTYCDLDKKENSDILNAIDRYFEYELKNNKMNNHLLSNLKIILDKKTLSALFNIKPNNQAKNRL